MSQHLVDGVELGSSTLLKTVDVLVQDVAAPSNVYEGRSYSTPQESRRLVRAADNDEEDSKGSSSPQCCGFSTAAQVVTVLLVALVVGMLVVLIGLTSATLQEVKDLPETTVVTTAYPSLGLQGYESYSWQDVLSAAEGETVRFYSFDTDKYNDWIDSWLAPRLADDFEITLQRVPISDTTDAVDLIFQEIERELQSSSSQDVRQLSNGSVDLIWINGENFARLKNRGYAYNWATKVPNAKNFDFQSDAIKFDFGLATNGYEMPYNAAQCVFIYETRNVSQASIASIEKILQWIKDNPGKFTYAAPQFLDAKNDIDHDYTGSAFVRHVFYALAAPYTQFLGAFNEALYLQHAPKLFRTLRELEPFLFDASQRFGAEKATRYYPHSQEDVDQLFTEGHILLTLSYDVGHATFMISQGTWPSSVTATVLSGGTIANTNYVLIPVNAKHKLAAVVAGNLIASAQAMFSRAQPEVIGALQAYDPHSETFTHGGWNDAFAYIDRAESTPSIADLSAQRLSELNAQYITRIERDWFDCVLNYSVDFTAPAYCG